MESSSDLADFRPLTVLEIFLPFTPVSADTATSGHCPEPEVIVSFNCAEVESSLPQTSAVDEDNVSRKDVPADLEEQARREETLPADGGNFPQPATIPAETDECMENLGLTE